MNYDDTCTTCQGHKYIYDGEKQCCPACKGTGKFSSEKTNYEKALNTDRYPEYRQIYATLALVDEVREQTALLKSMQVDGVLSVYSLVEKC